jgi:hypothetical protein
MQINKIIGIEADACQTASHGGPEKLFTISYPHYFVNSHNCAPI